MQDVFFIHLSHLTLLVIITILCLFVFTSIYLYKKYRKKTFQVKAELLTETQDKHLKITGIIPEWLTGVYVRNGPMVVQINNLKISHWFDGLSMLHAFKIESDQILYTNKFLRSEPYNIVFKEKEISYLGFNNTNKNPLLKKIKDFIFFKKPINNANVNIAKINNQYVALTEIPLPVLFNINTLDTLGIFDFKDTLPKKYCFESAHPVLDNNTGDLINYLIDFGIDSKYIIYKIRADTSVREKIAEISCQNPSYMHTFSITENYIILVEYPLIVNPQDLIFDKKPFIQNYQWKPWLGTKFIVIDRKTSEIVKQIKKSEALFSFHHVNAYEENDNIVLDLICYPDPTLVYNISTYINLEGKTFEKSDFSNKIQLFRFIISLNGKAFNGELSDGEEIYKHILFNEPIEFPKINEMFRAKKYRYVYGVDPRGLDNALDLRAIYKIDLDQKILHTWQVPGFIPGEPTFVSNDLSQEEDEGVLISIILDTITQQSFLLILNAKNLTEIMRAYTPYPIPVGLHGQFYHNFDKLMKK